MNTMALRSMTKQLTYSDTFTASVQTIAPKIGMKPYFGGLTTEEIIATCQLLQSLKEEVAIDYIGTAIIDAADVMTEKAKIQQLMTQLQDLAISATFTLQPEQFGLLLDVDECYNVISDVAAFAKKTGHFITLQTAEYEHVQTIISMAQQLQATYDHVSVVIQGQFYRSQDDIEALQDAPVTLSKKLSNTSEAVAFQKKMDLDLNMIALVEQRLKSGAYTVIATHDRNIIAYAKRLAQEFDIHPSQFEFQLHIGQDDVLKQALIADGYRVRTYFPAGAYWYTHFMNHVANRPQNLKYVSEKVFTKKTNIALVTIAGALLLRKVFKRKNNNKEA